MAELDSPRGMPRQLAGRLPDPEFRAEFERQQAEIAAVDAMVNELDGLRERSGMTKAGLARAIDKNPARAVAGE